VPGSRETRDEAAAPLRILVVDDDPDATELLCLGLERKGYQVHIAGSCEEARDIMATQVLDILVADLSLPDGSGHDLARFGSQGGNPPARIALSGFGRDVDIERSLEAGFHEHLTKPISIGDLIAALQRVARPRGAP
jgi:CheY-like chemotaxis protein